MRLLLALALSSSVSSLGAEPERSRFAADFSAGPSVGLLVAATGSGPIGGVGLHSSVTFRVSPFVAVGLAADAQLWLPNSIFFLATLAPAVRLGDVGHVTIALGPSLLVVAAYRGGLLPMGTLLVHGGFRLHRAFGVHPQLSVSVGRDFVIVGLGLGFGGSVF